MRVRQDYDCPKGTVSKKGVNMSEVCKKCKGEATWEIEVVFQGPVMPRNGIYYACDGCRDEVAQIRTSHYRFNKL